jgi:hypothetical protein
MRFDDASKVSMVVWDMRLADLPRGTDRATLQKLYNGNPPFDETTAEENGVQINRNFLEGPNMLARSRRQFDTALLQGGVFFNVSLDSGPVHKRRDWASIITRNLNRPLKESPIYLETIQSTTANIVLHGIAPSIWKNRSAAIPTPMGVEALLIPSDTFRSFENLEYFALFHQFTPSQLYDLTHGPKVDPGWNMKLVRERLEYAATEYRKNINSSAYQYMPEKIEELIKQDKGFWGTDAVPTIDCWDFYFREAEDGAGWYRRIVLDWGIGFGGAAYSGEMPKDNVGDFLYTSKRRKYANNLSEILHCQFGDASAVAPFRYHSVRSLGWMLWGVCDIMNRLRCQFTQSVFEQLMWFFRSTSQQTFERIKKANFTHMGVIPDGIAFVGAQERFKPDAGLVEMAFDGNRQLISENSAGFTPSLDPSAGKEMKATEVVARENAGNAMATGMLTSIYSRQKMQGMEIARRMCKKESKDPMAREFRLRCLKEGIPAEFLDSDRWIIDVERTLGGGNKTLEVSQAKALMEAKPQYDPEAQAEILHIYSEAVTSDAALAERLVPLGKDKAVSDGTQIGQMAAGVLMQGLPFSFKTGANHIDITEALLHGMSVEIAKVEQNKGMATPQQLMGLGSLAHEIEGQIKIIGANPEEKERVKGYGDDLGKMNNLIRAYAQRLQEEEQKQAEQNGNGKLDPKDQAKIQATIISAQAKAQNTRESHASRTAQKQLSFEMQQKQKDAQHAQDLEHKAQDAALDIHKKEAETAIDLTAQSRRSKLKSFEE